MKNRKGFLLVGVLFAFLFLMIIVPVMVRWIQDDTKMSVKDQKTSAAFGLAEAAVDRGYWKVKSSTSTFNIINNGGTIPGYNFDVSYTDISGGTYRIKVSSGPGDSQITVLGEGRDTGRNETRAIEAVYTNTSVPGAIVASGKITASESSVIHWGPIMSMADIEVTGGAITNGYPRKLSRQVVKPFDTTTDPPNTDSLEWWSNYNVPELPVFDFETLRASAAYTHTLNCQDVTVNVYTSNTATVYSPCVGSGCSDPGFNCSCAAKHCHGSGCSDPGSNCSCSGWGSSKVCTGSACPDPGANCDCTEKTCTGTGCADSGSNCACTTDTQVTVTTTTRVEMQCCHDDGTLGGPITCDYGGTGCTNCAVTDLYSQTDGYNQTVRRDMDYTWFWDNNAAWSGQNGLKGTVIVKGNLSIAGGDYYSPPGDILPVPPGAWREYQKYDTATVGQYPGDLGYHSSALTYTMGTNASGSCSGSPSLVSKGELWRYPCGSSGLGSDLGVYGFLYVGGNFTRTGDSDIYGSMWVEGTVTGSGNTMVFYNSNLKIATLNVVLVQDSWKEDKPSAQAWP
ncbi:MAG TPA: hypothetical protein PKI19_10740 [Elusimicrobiales bacterium]|nr:hypothetical protein [Elusimicrobiales bacterium]